VAGAEFRCTSFPPFRAFCRWTQGWIAGLGGTILATRDGGTTWQSPDAPRRYPAPWYFAAVLLCLALTLPAPSGPDIVVPLRLSGLLGDLVIVVNQCRSYVSSQRVCPALFSQD
jgi:hypothetical protein